MQPRKISTSTYIILFIFASIIGFWMGVIIERTVYPRITISASTHDETRMVQWVYDHSTLISRVQCQELVREAMKTPWPELIIALIELESIKFTPGAMSRDKHGNPLAIGWCQINIQIHEKELIEAGIIIERRDLWNMDCNIKAGTYIFTQKIKESDGNVARALEGYLGGRDSKYVLRVLSNYADLTIKK